MREVAGVLFDGSTSRARPARLQGYADGTIRLSCEGSERALAPEALGIASRLGDTPRRIDLPDGAHFETDDNDGVDALEALAAPSRSGWVHRLENRLPAVVLAAALVLLSGGVFAVYGIPALARQAAFSVSPELASQLGRGTLEVLDQTLEPSELSEGRRAALRAAFEEVVSQASTDYGYELVFRGGGLVGANAFALPSGTVVLTDELVALAQHEEEIVAVLAHEVGHVVNRHGLRQAIQSSLLAVGIVLLTGDLSATSSVVAALPALLAESRYSRDFEREADDYAVAYLNSRGVEASRLGDLLLRMEEQAGRGLDVSFLSTHPSTAERVARLGSPPSDG